MCCWPSTVPAPLASLGRHFWNTCSKLARSNHTYWRIQGDLYRHTFNATRKACKEFPPCPPLQPLKHETHVPQNRPNYRRPVRNDGRIRKILSDQNVGLAIRHILLPCQIFGSRQHNCRTAAANNNTGSISVIRTLQAVVPRLGGPERNDASQARSQACRSSHLFDALGSISTHVTLDPSCASLFCMSVDVHTQIQLS